MFQCALCALEYQSIEQVLRSEYFEGRHMISRTSSCSLLILKQGLRKLFELSQ